MSQRIRVAVPVTGQTVYGVLIRQEDALIWNSSSLEAFLAGDWASYGVSLSELGGSRIYDAAIPSGLPAGVYDVIAYFRAGGSPSISDQFAGTGSLDFSGSGATVVGTPLGQMTGTAFYTYVVRSGLVRLDLEDEVYDAVTDTVMEVEQLFTMRDRETETISTASIGTVGDYTLALEADNGYLESVTLIDGALSHQLNPISKPMFNELYPYPGQNFGRARPRDYAVFGGKAYLGPAPDKTSYQYRFDYGARLTAAIASATGVPFTDKFREVLKDGTLSRVFGNLINMERANYFDGKYQRGLTRIDRGIRDDHFAGGNVEYRGV